MGCVVENQGVVLLLQKYPKWKWTIARQGRGEGMQDEWMLRRTGSSRFSWHVQFNAIYLQYRHHSGLVFILLCGKRARVYLGIFHPIWW